jgi:hypothetical protein
MNTAYRGEAGFAIFNCINVDFPTGERRKNPISDAARPQVFIPHVIEGKLKGRGEIVAPEERSGD